MSVRDATTLAVETRAVDGSRAVRRLRRGGRVPGILYGGGEEPKAFQVDARALRNTLSGHGAVIELALDGDRAVPAVLKDEQRHPVSGHTLHVDLLRVRLDRAIQTTVFIELVGAEDAPGVREGGVMGQVARELTIEALPTAIPDFISLDVADMEIHDTRTLAAVVAPEGVTLIDDPETVVATCTPPRLEVSSDEELEQETELVGGPDAAAEELAEEGAGDSGEHESGSG
jgi:large subunit ribosomal protein L25